MCLQLPFVLPHLKFYSLPELVDLFWQLSHLSAPQTPAPAAATDAVSPTTAAAPKDRVREFKSELLLQLSRRKHVLEKHLKPSQQPEQQQQLLVYRILYGGAKLKLQMKDAPEVFTLAARRGKSFSRPADCATLVSELKTQYCYCVCSV